MATKALRFDPVESPMLTSADVASIREFLRQYQEYQLVWAERVAEGVIARTRKPKSVLRCTDPDLRNWIKKYEMGEEVEEFNSETLMAHLIDKVAAATQAVSLKDVLVTGRTPATPEPYSRCLWRKGPRKSKLAAALPAPSDCASDAL